MTTKKTYIRPCFIHQYLGDDEGFICTSTNPNTEGLGDNAPGNGGSGDEEWAGTKEEVWDEVWNRSYQYGN